MGIRHTIISTIFILILLLLSHPDDIIGQNSSPISEYLSSTGLTDGSSETQKREVSSIYSELINNTESLNKVLTTYLVDKKGLRFLKDVNLKFKTFRESGEDNNTVLGVSYSYSQDINKRLISDKSSNSSGIAFSCNAEGSVAFESSVNPEDFLDSKLSFHFFHSSGGTVKAADEEIADRLNMLEDEMILIEDQEELENSPAWKEFLRIVSKHLSTQLYLDFSLVGGLESNQDFSNKQYTYGAQLGLDLKAWDNNSTLANLNVFDWPFAVIRYLTAVDEELTPLGSTIPTVLIGIDQVEPSYDSLRSFVKDTDPYPRLRAEVSFTTVVSESSKFSANFRYYKELDADPEIESASIDEFMYFVATISMDSGFYISYSRGKLPFDAETDRVYELGFKFGF